MTSPDPRARAYRRPISVWWWLEKRSYFVFMMRELSSLFVAWTVVFLLVLLGAVAGGEDDYRSFLDWAASPWVVVLNLVALGFLLLHTVTWFDLTPKAMVVRLGGRRVSAAVILASQYAGWAAVSAFVLWLVTR
jgi:fumarate reductase subunit C